MYSSTVLAVLFGASVASAVPNAAAWKPLVGTPWQISLSKMIDSTQPLTPDVAVYDVDLFALEEQPNMIAEFHKKGKKVICYFSAGSYEDWRPDAKDFQPADLGSVMEDWEGEKWLDVRTANVRAIMTKRIEKAAACGCDAIDPDNVDGWANPTGKPLTKQDSIDYLRWMAGVASANNLAIGLKNAGEIVNDVKDVFQFSVVEQCHSYNECKLYQPFITQGKPVFSIEYPKDAKTKGAEVCDSYSKSTADYQPSDSGFSILLKTIGLDQWVHACPIKGAAPAAPSSSAAPVPAPSTSTKTPVPTETSEPTYGGEAPPATTAAPEPTATANPGQGSGSTLTTLPSSSNTRTRTRSHTRSRTRTGYGSAPTPTKDSDSGNGKDCNVIYVED